MADIVSPKVRSRMMAGIRGKNTKPEFFVRKLLFSKGFRYRLHDRKLPGKPDLVFARHKAVVLVHGCFWHGHECHLFRLPATRTQFWKMKIEANQQRDAVVRSQLIELGWRVLEVWECALRGPKRLDPDTLGNRLSNWIASNRKHSYIGGSR